MASKRRSNTLTRFFENIVDDTKDFVDDLLDRAKDIETDVKDAVTDVKDAVTDVTDDDEGRSSADDTAALRQHLKELQAKVNELPQGECVLATIRR